MASLIRWVNGETGCFEQAAVNRREDLCSDLAQRVNGGSVATLNWGINGRTLAALNRRVNGGSISIAALNRLINMVTLTRWVDGH